MRNVSDVDESRTVFLLPSDMQLTLFEREVSKESLHPRLRSVIAALLNEVRKVFDVVLIDCPPGLSILTECWLREADFYISPTKADYISVCGLEVFRRFKSLNPEMGFAENLGVIVNIDLHQANFAAIARDDFLQQRSELLTRGAPRRPEIDKHRHVAGGLDHIFGETRCGRALNELGVCCPLKHPKIHLR
ncbi:unnamed protein product, partial [marine sediment metagenome]